MNLIKNIGVIFLLPYLTLSQENAGTNVAPALQECYNTTRHVTREYRLPSTINVLVALIRRIEEENPTQDARELSYQILHRFRQDGIKKTYKDIDSSKGLPYSPTRVEAYRNRVQLTKITPGNAFSFNNDSLSKLQSCSLHYLVSGTIETQERGDEASVCGRLSHYTARIHKREAELTESHQRSTCPIESGVIYTKWGAVKVGTVLAGIAAGFQPQKIERTTLENTYASTLAGDLAEITLNQPSTPSIGNSGGWNNTAEPKYYFLSSSDKNNLYLTDAEIRGSLDGLYISLNIQNWKNTASNLKISQILDLYYGRGVFNDTSRACNRKSLSENLVKDTKLSNQTVAFSKLLDDESQLGYTPKEEMLPDWVSTTVNAFRSYISSNLNDLKCQTDDDLIEKVSTDVLIFIDSSWNHQIIQPLVSNILENLEINKYESSYTLFDGTNCDIIVNKSRSILDYYEQFNITEQQKIPVGFDFNKVMQVSERIFKAKLDNETDLTGQSMVILMLPHSTPTQSQSQYVQDKRNYFKTILPDVRIIVGGPGTKTSYNELVTNPTSDIIVIAEDTKDTLISTSATSIVDRFRKIPRGVVNSQCGSSFSHGGTTNFALTQYVEPSSINYHRISPNYFYEGQNLKIKGEGYGTITVCTSRTEPNPRANTTGVNCKTLNSDEMTLDLSSYCSDSEVLLCSPIFISVTGEVSSVRCTDQACRFPDNIKYSISLENVGCSSSTDILIPSFLIVSLLFMIMRF